MSSFTLPADQPRPSPTPRPAGPPRPLAPVGGVAATLDVLALGVTARVSAGLPEPGDLFVATDHATLYFGTAPLAVLLGWAESLDADPYVLWQATDAVEDVTGVTVRGALDGVPVLMHTVTSVRLPHVPTWHDVALAADEDARVREVAAQVAGSSS